MYCADTSVVEILENLLGRPLHDTNERELREVTLWIACTFLAEGAPCALPRADVPLSDVALSLARTACAATERTGRMLLQDVGIAPRPPWLRSEQERGATDLEEWRNALFGIPTPDTLGPDLAEARFQLFGDSGSTRVTPSPREPGDLDAIAKRLGLR